MFAPAKYQFACSNHNMGNKTSLVPSTVFDINILDNSKLSNCHERIVYVILKETYLQASNTIYHSLELYKIVGSIT